MIEILSFSLEFLGCISGVRLQPANGVLRSLEIVRVLVRFDHVASVIVNANHSVVRSAAKLRVADCITDRVRKGRNNAA